ncbi:MAG: DMT family transporter [Betaproteobacteria bacterium]|nr:MAG: DMT family transporter [Betaproteobacteria bacterium]
MTLGSGIAPALIAAILFGASTPLARALIGAIDPAWLAGCLYAGSGLGLSALYALRRAGGNAKRISPLTRRDLPWLAATIASGGIVAPLLFTFGLRATTGATASLLLNLETVLTVMLAWFVFREHYGPRVVVGMASIVAACTLLGWGERDLAGVGGGALLIALACLGWALDNNLTRKIAGSDALSIAMAKGLCGGAVNLALAAALAGPPPAPVAAIAAGVVGFLGYGVSLVLFVVALRHLGTARASAYYATAPFIGGAVAFAVLAERPGSIFWIALPLMALGVWLHLTERHAHLHSHEAMVHDHPHEHDEHHRHAHDFPWDGTEPHAHPHTHEQVTHAHAHFPDAHHRHGH